MAAVSWRAQREHECGAGYTGPQCETIVAKCTGSYCTVFATSKSYGAELGGLAGAMPSVRLAPTRRVWMVIRGLVVGQLD